MVEENMKIELSDFLKVEMRVGQIIEANAPEWSNKLLEFKVDFGTELGQRTICSAIRKWYQPEFFMDKKFIFVTNLAERKMGPSVSQGMMLMVDLGDKVQLVFAPDNAPLGAPLG